MKKRTLLYFGSFNPIHIGHLAIANYAMVSGIAEELWFVVSPQNPFKAGETLAPQEERLEMVRMAIRESGLNGMMCASDVEFGLPAPSYTIRTLEKLWSDYPDREFSILMGEDNFASIERWKEPERILENCPVYVYRRSGNQPMNTHYNVYNIHLLTDVPLLEISSTQLRGLLAAGKEIPALLPPGVYQFIKTHGLYRING